ncbi:NADP-dependent oxidoreductase domain-containing protein [Cantharellus anzutake]|uniref:NADP-dependent oxidoreductase domain-containing protein n=1 Tax=Cantharellus anzutake TaxID=1750568 RepID=UPI00190820EE|nr:NADP-dependent oxidoreductase domain-containing protein [Cantharellus anzutake]KAF8311920.1 NADP-dependent oxidoreductase domain-containing protein [Cantharellus anzutake]
MSLKQRVVGLLAVGGDVLTAVNAASGLFPPLQFATRATLLILSEIKQCKLPSGDKIPAIALGTWKSRPGETELARFTDRKTWGGILDRTLTALQTSYLDLYLVHWPVAFEKGTREVDADLTENPCTTVVEMVDKGKVRNIGVSNFNSRRLENLTASPLKYQPAVNQVETNWLNSRPKLLEWSRNNGTLLETYSPLGSDRQVKDSFTIISWLKQRGVVVLPKSVIPPGIQENIQVFELPREAFDKIEKSATSHKPQRVVNLSEQWGHDIFKDE